MITLVVVAIIAAIALPNYFESLRRSRMTDAFQTMTQFRTRMEQAAASPRFATVPLNHTFPLALTPFVSAVSTYGTGSGPPPEGGAF